MGRARRRSRIGVPHHVAHRGNHKRSLFETDTDRRYYLALLHRHSRLTQSRIAGFCLMSNHVHILIVPEALSSISDCIGRVHRKYSEHLNRQHGLRGTNWEGRHFCQPMDEAHAINALRYVERNPVDAGLVRAASYWEWSSAAGHCLLRQPWPLVNVDIRGSMQSPERWSAMLGLPLDDEDLCALHWPALAESTGELAHGVYG